jgi:hypothetical protein
MSSSDYVRFLTEQFVRYIDNPKQQRPNKKERQPRGYKWFGLVPLALGIFFRKRSKR